MERQGCRVCVHDRRPLACLGGFPALGVATHSPNICDELFSVLRSIGLLVVKSMVPGPSNRNILQDPTKSPTFWEVVIL